MESHRLSTHALQNVDREMSNLGLTSLATHKKNIAPARSTIAPDISTTTPPDLPAEIDLGDDPPIAPKARSLIQSARSHRSSPQMSPSPITIPGLPPTQSSALSASMLFSQSPNYSPKSPATDASPAAEVSQGIRRSTRAATVAASANVVRRALILSCALLKLYRRLAPYRAQAGSVRARLMSRPGMRQNRSLYTHLPLPVARLRQPRPCRRLSARFKKRSPHMRSP